MTATYRFARFVSYAYFKVFHRFRVCGLENIPASGAFLLASNHVSFFDPPALGCRLPRNLHYFARSTLFKGAFGKLITALNSIPINRDGADSSSFRRAFKTLNKGFPLLVFPEGTRSPDGRLQDPRRGVGLIACKAGVPVVPARVFGGHEAFGKGRKTPKLGVRFTVAYGTPFPIEAIDPGREQPDRYDLVAEAIMEAIRNLPAPLI